MRVKRMLFVLTWVQKINEFVFVLTEKIFPKMSFYSFDLIYFINSLFQILDPYSVFCHTQAAVS